MIINELTRELYNLKLKECQFRKRVDKYIKGNYIIEKHTYNTTHKIDVYHAETLYEAKKRLLGIISRQDVKYADIELYEPYTMSDLSGECIIFDVGIKRIGDFKLAKSFT